MSYQKHGKYQVFHRTWWIKNPDWPDGREPGVGPRHVIGYADTDEEAREMCKQWNDTHDPGELSDKAEYSSDW